MHELFDNSQILDNLEQYLFVKDCASTYLYVNEPYAKLLDARPDAIIGKNDLDLFPTEIAEKYRSDDKRVYETAVTLEMLEPIVINGENRTIKTIKKPLFDDKQNIIGILGIFWDITAETEREQKLYNLGLLIKQIPGAVAMFDNQMQYIAYSDMWREEYHILPEDIRGMLHYDLFPDNAERWKAIHRRGLKGETISSERDRFTCRDGSNKWMRWTVSPWYSSGGAIGGIIMSTTNITEIVEAERELQRQKNSLDEAQQLAQIGHWELDLRKNHLYWSDEVYRIFGMQPNEFAATYEAFLERIHPDDRDMVNNAYASSVEKKSSYHISHRITTIRGELRYVEERCIHDFDSDGNVYRSIGTVHDVTDKMRATHELELASRVFTHATEGVLITDEWNKIITVNKRFETITGYSLEELKGEDPKIFSSGWGDKHFYRALWDDLLNKGEWSGEVWDRKKNGTLYAAALSIVAVRNEAGAITNYIAFNNDITENKEREKTINQLAYYDFLTKLPNRVLLQEKVNTIIHSAQFEHKTFAMLFLDLDNFKWVNDTLGHKAGDRLLVEVAERMKRVLPESTMLSRLGGDEFIILLLYHQPMTISHHAQKLVDTLGEPFYLDQQPIRLGCSIGISTFPDNGSTFDTLMQHADIAMYQAKHGGKSAYQYFSAEMNTAIRNRVAMEMNITEALKQNRFELYYQPKFCLQKRHYFGMEALLRWNDPKLGFISPAEFIPIAEESGLIKEIGHFVLEQALRDSKRFDDAGLPPLILSVNVSSIQLQINRFPDILVDLIASSGVDPSRIELEITESAIMENIDYNVALLKRIKAIGFHLSVDDFGTGYSSMAYLKKLPIDTIKIDREFVKDIHTDDDDKAIMEAIVAMSKRLKLSTIAEGVETLEHEKLLLEAGCEAAQGFLYSRAVPADAFIKLFTS